MVTIRTARGPTSRWWGPSVYLRLRLRVKDRRSPLSPRMYDSELSSSPYPASRARSICRSGQGRVASVFVAYERYASGAYDRADSRSQLVRLVASPPPPYALLRKFSLFFFQLAVNELDWMSSEANVLRLCAALDKLRLGSLRGPPSRRSSYWLG